MLKKNLTIFFALFLFFSFWIFTVFFILNKKLCQKKVSSTTWVYSQLFSQSWNFFTQPALYNDKLLITIYDSDTHQINTINLLEQLWQQKRKSVFNASANVWDHIILRTNNSIRERIKSGTFTENVLTKKNYNEVQLINNEENIRLYNNLKSFVDYELAILNLNENNCYYVFKLQTSFIKPFNQNFTTNDTTIFTSPLIKCSQ